jgi:hypothetical protein
MFLLLGWAKISREKVSTNSNAHDVEIASFFILLI